MFRCVRSFATLAVLLGVILVSAPQARAASVELLRDIDDVEVAANSEPQFMGAVGNLMLFGARNENGTRWLYRSDGTTGGTVAIGGAIANRNIYPAKVSVIGSRALFFADATVSPDRELWISDGTDAGTQFLVNVGIPAFWLGKTNNFAYFASGSRDGKFDVWRTDGTAGGTFRILQGRNNVADIGWAIGGQFYFPLQVSSTSGTDLWVSDGTAGGTRLIYKPASTGLLRVDSLTNVGSDLLICGANENSRALYLLDPVAGTPILLTDNVSNYGECDLQNSPQVGASVFFVGNRRLWRTDGTVAGTFALTPESLSEGVRAPLGIAGNRVLFSYATESSSRSLWVTDGSSVGTQLLQDFDASGGNTVIISSEGGSVFLAGGSGIAPGTGMQLWVSDGTANGTRRVTHRSRATYDLGIPLSIRVASTQIFIFASQFGGIGTRWWRTDLAATDIIDLGPGELGEVAGTRLYFSQLDARGVEPWTSDGTLAGTALLRDIARTYRTGDSSPRNHVALGDLLIFTATDSASGTELWRADGTRAGTLRLADINPGQGSSMPFGLIAIGLYVYFSAVDTAGVLDGSARLWRTDGTPSGTVKLGDTIVAATVNGGNCPRWAAPFNGRTWFFGARDSLSAKQLWSTDGTPAGTRFEATMPSQVATSLTCELVPIDGGLLIGLSSAIWRTDGTAAGTVIVRDINPDGNDVPNDFAGFTTIGTVHYFQGTDGSSGFELWRTDGTGAGTARVIDLVPGAGSSDLRLLPFGNRLFFSALTPDDATTGVYISDGTSGGTVRLRPGVVQAGLAMPGVVSGSRAFFMSRDLTQASQAEALWVTDGTAAGTRQIMAAPVGGSFGIYQAIGFDGALFFTGIFGGIEQIGMSDGSAAGTRQLTNLTGGFQRINEPLALLRGRLIFNHYDAALGTEPYIVRNQNPTANADVATTTAGSAVFVAVLANDTDPDGNVSVAGVYVSSEPENGTAIVENGGIRYTPRQGFSGSDSFQYRIIDDFGASAPPATVAITVNAAPAPPPSRGGGGGAFDPRWLLLLLVLRKSFTLWSQAAFSLRGYAANIGANA